MPLQCSLYNLTAHARSPNIHCIDHVSRSIEIFTVLISPHVQDGQIKQGAAQPMYLQTDLKSFDLSGLGVKFDVMLVEPPLEEYQRRASGVNFSWSPWEWEEVRRGVRGKIKEEKEVP